MILNKIFDYTFFWKKFWERILKYINKKSIDLKELEKELDLKEWYINRLLAWKITPKTLEIYKKVAFWAWMSRWKFEKIYFESRRDEYMYSTRKTNKINLLNKTELDSINLLEWIDFDNDFLRNSKF
jgi:hypothetical protein